MPKENSRSVLLVSSKYPPEYSGSGLRAHRTYKRLAQRYGLIPEVLCGSVQFNRPARYDHEGFSVRRIACKLLPFRAPDYRLTVSQGRRLHHLPGTLGVRLARRIGLWINYWTEGIPAFLFLWKRRREIKLLHIFGDNAVTSAALQFAALFHVPTIIELVNQSDRPFSYRPFLLSWIDQARVYRQADIVCISPSLQDMAERHGLKKIWCRPNPVDEQRFFPEPDRRLEYREQLLGPSEPALWLLYVAPFTKYKNSAFLIDVLSHLPAPWRLLLVSPNPPESAEERAQYDQIIAAIKEKGLKDRVVVRIGFVEKVEHYFKMADVYAMPGLNEALGTPMLESIACGVPVVASRLPGVTDVWIHDGVNGFVSDLEPRVYADKVQAAQRISPSVMLDSARQILSQAGAQRIDERYWHIIQQALGSTQGSDKDDRPRAFAADRTRASGLERASHPR